MKNVVCVLFVLMLGLLVIGCAQKEEPPAGTPAKPDQAQTANKETVKPADGAKTDANEKPAPDTTGKPAPDTTEKPAPSEPAKPMFTLRVDCGSEADYTDPDGNVWKADRPFAKGAWGQIGGEVVTRDAALKIAKTKMIPLYLTELFGLSAYKVTCPNGTYTVTLHFAETYHEYAGERAFDVAIEGKNVLKDFDPAKAAGNPYTAFVKTVPDVQVTDGELTIDFTEKVELPLINGLEVVQTK